MAADTSLMLLEDSEHDEDDADMSFLEDNGLIDDDAEGDVCGGGPPPVREAFARTFCGHVAGVKQKRERYCIQKSAT